MWRGQDTCGVISRCAESARIPYRTHTAHQHSAWTTATTCTSAGPAFGSAADPAAQTALDAVAAGCPGRIRRKRGWRHQRTLCSGPAVVTIRSEITKTPLSARAAIVAIAVTRPGRVGGAGVAALPGRSCKQRRPDQLREHADAFVHELRLYAYNQADTRRGTRVCWVT